jgi:hypothetical protein
MIDYLPARTMMPEGWRIRGLWRIYVNEDDHFILSLEPEAVLPGW